MSDKPRPIDLGPMYLPLGRERPHEPPKASKPPATGRREDVERFKALMEGTEQARLHSPGLVAPVSLLARRDGGDRPPRDEGEGPGLADAMERLWASEGLDGEREVRIGWRNQILPDTAVRMRLHEGRLQVDLSCLDGRTAHQLAGQLECLANELGTRLGREVLVTVEHLDHGLVRRAGWAPEQP